MTPSLYELTPERLAEVMGGPGRARNVWRGLVAGEGFAGLGRRTATRLFGRCRTELPDVLEEVTSTCGTRKLLLGLEDERRIESVVIPTENRSTVCLSTQVGCARGCTFCVTATMGLVRQLTVSEIVSQLVVAIAAARRGKLPAVRNVVLMGMGEPLDNLDAVIPALELITHPLAFGLGPGHVTLSTVGTSPQAIRRLVGVPARLAWSVHSADDAQRRALIPTAKYSLSELRDAFAAVLAERGDDLFVEVTLVRGENDSPQHAEALGAFLLPLGARTRVNLLPANPGREGIEPSGRAEAFAAVLEAAGLWVMVRTARGAKDGAACGQLAA